MNNRGFVFKLPTQKRVDADVLENNVETALIRGVTQNGGECKKFTGYRGWPDRICLWFGPFTDWLEIKRPIGGQFEPLQLHTHDKLRSMGFEVFVCLTKKEVSDYVRYAIRRNEHFRTSR